MEPSPSHDSPVFSRRKLLAAGGAAVSIAASGCTGVIDAIGNQLLDHVNVFNETDGRISGSIEVTDPADATILDETFDLAPRDSEDESDDDSSTATFEEVWGEPGSYEVSVELDDTEIDGTSRASETVAIDDPDEEMLAVALGSEEVDDPIGFRVGVSLSDFARTETDDG